MIVRRPGLRFGTVFLLLSIGVVELGNATEKPAHNEYGTRLTFHGWSADAKYIAYTRRRVTPAKNKALAPEVLLKNMHHRVRRCALSGGGPRPKTSEHDFGQWVRGLGYQAEARRGVSIDEGLFQFDTPEGRYMLDIQVGPKIAWEFSFEGERIVRRPFHGLYVDFEVSLYPAPDRSCAVLVVHLNTGWRIDAAVYPVPLPAKVRERWKLLTAPVPEDAQVPVQGP